MYQAIHGVGCLRKLLAAILVYAARIDPDPFCFATPGKAAGFDDLAMTRSSDLPFLSMVLCTDAMASLRFSSADWLGRREAAHGKRAAACLHV